MPMKAFLFCTPVMTIGKINVIGKLLFLIIALSALNIHINSLQAA
jgi:hypothetical protein